MLESINISDYALIDDLKVEFRPGLNIFTGSTGAGKTIIFGALGLALGDRASGEIIRTGAKTSAIEAVYSLENTDRLPVEYLENSDSLIIRRTINKDGRSRTYINDRQVTLASLKTVGASLTDIIGQHRQKGLTDSINHRQILDIYAGLNDELTGLADLYNQYFEHKNKYDELEYKQGREASEKELLEFQLKEIDQASLTEGEDEQLLLEKHQLVNSEKIKTTCQLCSNSLFDEDGSASERIKSSIKEISNLIKYSDNAETIKNKIEEISINLDEAGILLRELSDSFEFDQARLEIVEERIVLINRLKRKYGKTISEILHFYDEAKTRIDNFHSMDKDLNELLNELSTCQHHLSQKALDISQKRMNAAKALEKEVVKHLSDLAMKGADLKVGFEFKESSDGPFIVEQKKYTGGEHGFDSVEFLICPNKGEQLKPLATTASGGELSRILLALCSALQEVFPRNTLIFDEIDAGISGDVASQVGKKLQMLAQNRQVICITHLQQIASRGETHFKVYKGKNKGRSVTRVKMLDGSQRVAEIARLLAGEKISDVALDGAVKLLKEGRS